MSNECLGMVCTILVFLSITLGCILMYKHAQLLEIKATLKLEKYQAKKLRDRLNKTNKEWFEYNTATVLMWQDRYSAIKKKYIELIKYLRCEDLQNFDIRIK